MRFKKYKLTPFDVIKDGDIHFNKRSMYPITISWNVSPPSGGKAYKLYVLMKKHVEYTIFLCSVMSTDELYKIKLAIDSGDVPVFFDEIVASFYNVKKNGGFLTSITISKLDIFDYEDHNKFRVPEEKYNMRRLIPEVKIRIPSLTAEQIVRIRQLAEENKDARHD